MNRAQSVCIASTNHSAAIVALRLDNRYDDRNQLVSDQPIRLQPCRPQAEQRRVLTISRSMDAAGALPTVTWQRQTRQWAHRTHLRRQDGPVVACLRWCLRRLGRNQPTADQKLGSSGSACSLMPFNQTGVPSGYAP